MIACERITAVSVPAERHKNHFDGKPPNRRLAICAFAKKIHLSVISTIRPLGFNLQNMAFLKLAVERML
jgi:hypothetical protein